MHILIMPSELYVTKLSPLSAIFQYQQAHALNENKILVGVVSAGFVPFKMMLTKYPYPPFERDDAVNIYRCYKKTFIPGRIAVKAFFKYLVSLYLKTFEKYINSHGKPDIIHAHNCLYAGVVALKIKEQYSIPYLITEHSSLYSRGLVSNQQAGLTKEVLKNADSITVVSTGLGRLLENLFGEFACPYYPIFNIIEGRFEEKKNIIKCVKKDKNVFTFLSIGSLDANKNHAELLDSFAYKFKGNSKVLLKIGGAGPLKKQLQTKSKELGIEEQVVLTGQLSRDRVFGEMQNCDVFVLPSIVETFGVVLIEALALGKPVIASKCGGPEDIVNEYNGILIPPKKMNALAEAMSNIYLNIDKYDACLIRNDCLSRFGKDAFVKRLQAIYTNILDKGKRQYK